MQVRAISVNPVNYKIRSGQYKREIEAGAPRNTPPDNPFDDVRTSSNE